MPMIASSIRNIAAAATLSLALATSAGAAELKVFCTQALTGTFARLGPQFERDTGNKLVMTYGATGQLMGRIAKGEAFDVAILTTSAVDELAKQGKVVAQGRTGVARAGIGVAMRPGAARPDLGSAEAFKKIMLGAKAVTYTDPAGGGASGVYAGELMKRLGIAEQMQAKTRLAPAGTSSAALVVSGDAEYAIQMISELVLVAGVEVAGPLPPDLQSYTDMAAGVGAAASDAAAAQRLVQFLVSPAAAPVLKASGLEPAK